MKLKYQLLHEQMRVTDASAAATREFQQTSLSADNQTMDVYCLRLVPFNVDQISAIAWRWGKHEFDGCHFEQVSLLARLVCELFALLALFHMRLGSKSNEHAHAQAGARDQSSESRCHEAHTSRSLQALCD